MACKKRPNLTVNKPIDADERLCMLRELLTA